MQVLPNGLVERPTPARLPDGFDTIARALEGAADQHRNELALIDQDQTWSFAELRADVERAARSVDGQEPVVVNGPNSAELVISVFAALTRGATIFFNPPESVDCTQLTRHLKSESVAPLCVGFTSGTSGTPKAVAHSERNLLIPALISASVEPPHDGERTGTTLSLAIINMMVLGPISALVRRSTFVVLPQTTPTTKGLVDGVRAHSVTRLFTVAPQLHDLVEHVDDPTPLRSLDRVIVGGSGANADTLARFGQRFGVRPTLSYGMTEAPTGVARESLSDPVGSGRGFPLPHVEVTIRSADGTILETHKEGEVCLGPATTGRWANTWTGTLGYLGNPDQTHELFANDVIHTGDRGYLDQDGALHITGRLTALIIRGAMNVDPAAVANTLLAHRTVIEAAVCGFDDDRLGQKIGAVVVAQPGHTIDPDELKALVKERLSSHAVPDVILQWPELPRGPLGKPSALDPTIFQTRRDATP